MKKINKITSSTCFRAPAVRSCSAERRDLHSTPENARHAKLIHFKLSKKKKTLRNRKMRR